MSLRLVVLAVFLLARTVPRLLLVVMGVVVVLRGESVTLCTSTRTVYALVRVCVSVHMAVSGGSGAVDGEWL